MIDASKVNVRTLPLPEDHLIWSATYTFTGTVLVSYTTPEDPADYMNLAIVNDDGSDWHKIWSGSVKSPIRGNGIRFMMFPDKKRIHFGSFILECTPDVDHCESAELVPVIYPDIFQEDRMFVWSENVVAPDSKHVGWTQLNMRKGSLNFVAELERKEDCYEQKNIQLISSLVGLEKDPDNEGLLKTYPFRGGELKQFVRGGKAISLVGAVRGGTSDSVIQDLDTEELHLMSKTPGYDETTIFSPDEKLGLVMTSRFSPKTDLGVIGLVPRPPYIFMAKGLSMPSWSYSVAAVRINVDGNVGPALVEIDRVLTEPDYKGICLADPKKEWVYSSPMSWHPNGVHGMFLEMKRGTLIRRVRIVEIDGYVPGETVPCDVFPENIPYAVPLEKVGALKEDASEIRGRIPGKHSGYILVNKNRMKTETTYEHYSDDGKRFWDGREVVVVGREKYEYEADVTLSGPDPGRIDLRVIFRRGTVGEPLPPFYIDHTPAEDGKPYSYGYATYGGKTLRVEDLY